MAPPIEKNTLLFHGTADLKFGFEAALRALFADINVIKNANYRYSDTEADTKIQIYRSFPNRVEFYPSITISTESHSAALTGLGSGQEELGETVDPGTGLLLTTSSYGHVIIPVTLTVHTLERQEDRDKLRDILVQIFRVLGRGAFSRYGIGYSHVDVGGDEQEEDQTGKIIYRGTVTVQVNTDYTETLSLVDEGIDDQLINNVVVDLFGRETFNATRVRLHTEP